MNDWNKIEKTFAAALELEAAARPAYLDEACGGDQPLRQEVESLLAFHTEASPTFLDRPVAVVAGLAPPPPPEAGDMVGAYRLIERLGQGGEWVRSTSASGPTGPLIARWR